MTLDKSAIASDFSGLFRHRIRQVFPPPSFSYALPSDVAAMLQR
jgi:hypothetical protein